MSRSPFKALLKRIATLLRMDLVRVDLFHHQGRVVVNEVHREVSDQSQKLISANMLNRGYDQLLNAVDRGGGS